MNSQEPRLLGPEALFPLPRAEEELFLLDQELLAEDLHSSCLSPTGPADPTRWLWIL